MKTPAKAMPDETICAAKSISTERSGTIVKGIYAITITPFPPLILSRDREADKRHKSAYPPRSWNTQKEVIQIKETVSSNRSAKDREHLSLKRKIRLMLVVDLAQSLLLGSLIIHILRIRAELSCTVQLITKLTDLISQQSDGLLQISDLIRQLLGCLG